MQIPEGYRLQLEGLSNTEKCKILSQLLGLPVTSSECTCIYPTDGGYGVITGPPISFNYEIRRLEPIYIAEELQQPAPEPEQTEIDLGSTRWADMPPEILFGSALTERQASRRAAEDSYISFDDVEPFEDF